MREPLFSAFRLGCALLAMAAMTALSHEVHAEVVATEGRSSVPAADAGSGGDAKGRKAEASASSRAGTAHAGAARQRSAGPAERSNADRVHALLGAKTRAPLGRRPSPTRRSSVGATGNAAAAGSRGVATGPSTASSAARSKTPGRATAAVIVPSIAAARISPVGAARASAPRPLGGAVMGRGVRNATLAGTEMRHKF